MSQNYRYGHVRVDELGMYVRFGHTRRLDGRHLWTLAKSLKRRSPLSILVTRDRTETALATSLSMSWSREHPMGWHGISKNDVPFDDQALVCPGREHFPFSRHHDLGATSKQTPQGPFQRLVIGRAEMATAMAREDFTASLPCSEACRRCGLRPFALTSLQRLRS